MFESTAAWLLNRILGKYVQDLDSEHLNVGVFSGEVRLTDLRLKPEALYELQLPIEVKCGVIGQVSLTIPWSAGLSAQPLCITIEDVLVVAVPVLGDMFDCELERRLVRAAKRKLVEQLENSCSFLLVQPTDGLQPGLTQQLAANLLGHVRVTLRNVHLRYEDTVSSPESPLSCGLCLHSLSLETTNSKWKPASPAAGASAVYQLARAESFSLYWNARTPPNALVLSCENWRHSMAQGLRTFSVNNEAFDFVVKPVSAKAKLIASRQAEARGVPRLLLDVVVQDAAVQLSRAQLVSMAMLHEAFQRMARNREFRELHPGVNPHGHAAQWWRYAFTAVLEQRVRPYSWTRIKRHRENYREYRNAFKETLLKPYDTELRLDLQKLEDRLGIVDIVVAREHAKMQLHSESPDRVSVTEKTAGWCSWLHHGGQPELRLDVATSRERGLWSRLSSQERDKLCEAAGLVSSSNTIPTDKPKHYIEHKFNLTLANVAATLLSHGHEIAVVTLTQVLTSLETRPAARAFRFSARADGLVLEGASAENELMPLFSADALDGGGSVLAIDFEKNPLAHDADYALSVQLEPFEVVYNEHTLSELLGFLQPPGVARAITRWLSDLSSAGKAAAKFATSRRKTLHLSLDLKGPYFVLPESGSLQRGGNVLIIDLGRLTVRSELQPRDALADADQLTQSELEERLYDRLHAELSGSQLLFCDSGEEWREARRRTQDCDLHVLGRVRATAVLSASVRPDYRQLPRHKLNVSLGSLKLNVSERRIASMLEFADALPLPAPKSLHSGTALPPPDLDTVLLPPGTPQLRALRSLLVSAHLAQQRGSGECTPGHGDASPAGLVLTRVPTLDHDRGSSEPSDDEPELWARAMDQPGFEDNVSPHNTITALLRFTLAELVIQASKGSREERPYLMLRLSKLCAELALMEYGPAMQLSLNSMQIVDKSSASGEGRYLEILSAESPRGDVLTLLYRKVRADCPDFKSHFHSVERSVVLELAALSMTLHREALLALSAFVGCVAARFHSHEATGSLLSLSRSWYQQASSSPPSRCSSRAAKSPRHHPIGSSTLSAHNAPCCCPATRCCCENAGDPPVPPGATKFSYSARLGEVRVRLCDHDLDFLEMKIWGLESDCVFKANEKLVLRMFLSGLQAEDLSDLTLYPKILYGEGEHVLDAKLVRHAPRFAGLGQQQNQSVKPDGSLRISLGRLHAVLLWKLATELQHFASPWLRPGVLANTVRNFVSSMWSRAEVSPMLLPRLQLALELHLPTLLIPQKSDSPNIVVVNLGDLSVENFYKAEGGGVIDNALVRLTGVQVSRAVMTLAGTLEAQEPVLEPAALRLDVRRAAAPPPPGSSPIPQPLWAVSGAVLEPGLRVNLGQRDLATLLAVASDNPAEAACAVSRPASSPPDTSPSSTHPSSATTTDSAIRQLQAFFCRSERARPESSVRLSLDSFTLTLFADMDEVLSSPVRDLERGLCRLQLCEFALALESSSDHRAELRASLQSARLDDLRNEGPVYVRRILETSAAASQGVASHVSVSSPPFLDISLRQAPSGDRVLDVVVERSRLNLSVPFLASLGRFLLDALPGERPSDGGLVNLGYVGDCPRDTVGSVMTLHDDRSCTSGYFSVDSEDAHAAGLSVTVQLRRPELMLLGDPALGPALLVRAEVSIDLSTQPPFRETLTLTVSQLQVVSRSQGVSSVTREVLVPCDVELRRCMSQGEAHVVVNVSAVDVRLCPRLVHVAAAVVDQLSAAVAPNNGDEEPQTPRQQHFLDLEEMWTPRKIPPCVPLQMECEETVPLSACSTASPRLLTPPPRPISETLDVNVPRVRLVFELDSSPVMWVKASLTAQAKDWSSQLRATAQMQLRAAIRNEALNTWEPLIEPFSLHQGKITAEHKPWQLEARVFHAPAFPVSSCVSAPEHELKQETQSRQMEQQQSRGNGATPRHRRPVHGDDSETSADEEQPREMTFVRYGDEFEVTVSAPTRGDAAAGGCSSREDSDSESEEGAVARLVGAIGHLCASPVGDSSAEEDSDSSAEDDSAKEVATSAGGIETHDALQLPGEEPRAAATHVLLNAKDRLEFTLTASSLEVLQELANAFQLDGETCCSSDKMTTSCLLSNEPSLALVNSLGPGSRVVMMSRTGEHGGDRQLASAAYDSDSSSPGSPAEPCASDGEAVCSDSDVSQFEGGFGRRALSGEEVLSPCYGLHEEPIAQQYKRVTEQRLVLRVEGLRELQVLVPRRQSTTLHTILGGPQRYLVAVSVEQHRGGRRRIEVRSPLRLRNDTAYALAINYRKSILDALGAEHVGEATNPFEDAVRMALLAPDETLSVPLLVAHHCRLHVRPAHLDLCAASELGLLLTELAPGDSPRDMTCLTKDNSDEAEQQTFCVRALVETTTVDSRDVLVRLVSPLVVLNELPLALELSAPESGVTRAYRLEAGAHSSLHALSPAQTHRILLKVPSYAGVAWSGSFSLTLDLEERSVSMTADAEAAAEDSHHRHLNLAVRLEHVQHAAAQLHVFASFWVLNKTGLPLQVRGVGTDAVYESLGGCEEPLLFSFRRRRRRAVRLRVHQSSWSSAFSLEAPGTSPGLIVCRDRERGDRRYRVLASVSTPQLCPQLSRVLTLLPCWMVSNATRKHLRFMEDNERADLWVDLAPGQNTTFWPETETMRMFVRMRGSQHVSSAFPIGRRHRTVLRMDKGCGITVEVSGGDTEPFCVWFRHAASGEAPVRVDNQCTELAVRLQQRGAANSCLLGPGQALLYTWDEPCREPRQLLWSIAKGDPGFVAEIDRDGYGSERVNCPAAAIAAASTNHQSQHPKLSSRLSAGLRKLSVRPVAEPLVSSSDDEERPQQQQARSLVYWVSYLEGRQRVLLITRDERLARQVRAARLDPERASLELCVSLAGLGLSLCGEDTRQRPREVAYLSLQESAPSWEVLGARRWRTLPAELAAWLEEKWHEEPRAQRAQLRDLVHVDLTTLRMTKPFFGELRRRHLPGFWLQYRRAENSSYLLCRLHRLQLDNQLRDATFPCVLYPGVALQRRTSADNGVSPPCVELSVLRSHRSGHLVIKYAKLLLGSEICLRLERGFLQAVLAATTCKLAGQERETVSREFRVRTDIAALHQPVSPVQNKCQVPVEYVYLSPICMRLTYQARSGEFTGCLPMRAHDVVTGLQRLLPEHVTDARLRLNALELRGGEIEDDILNLVTCHYSTQFAQQFAIRVLGLDVLSNPLLIAQTGPDPSDVRGPDDLSEGVALAALCSLGHINGGVASNPLLTLANECGETIRPSIADTNTWQSEDFSEENCSQGPPLFALVTSRSLDFALPLNIAGLFGSTTTPGGPPQPEDSFVRGAGRGVLALARRGNLHDCLTVVSDSLRRAVEAGEAPAVRTRLPRHLDHITGTRHYSVYESSGVRLLGMLGRGHFADTDDYWAHAPLDPRGAFLALITLQHVFLLTSRRGRGQTCSWDVQWATRLDEISSVPHVVGDKLILRMRQEQSEVEGGCRWFQCEDLACLQWLQRHLETAMIAVMHSRPL